MGERIVIDPKIMVGKPVVRGTRITVEAILKLLGKGTTVKEILEDYPQLKKEDIEAALNYGAHVIANEEVHLLPVKKRAKVSG